MAQNVSLADVAQSDQCGAKTRHTDLKAAQDHIRSLRSSGRHKKPHGKLHPYRCRICGWWHIGNGGRRK